MVAEQLAALALAAVVLTPALAAAQVRVAPPAGRTPAPAAPAPPTAPRADTAARMAALVELGQAGDRAALPTLLAALKDPNRDVRWVAIEALGELGDRRAVPALVQYLAAHRKEAYRWGKRLVANALGAIGGSEAVEALTPMLDDPDPFVRRDAALALLRQRDPALLARVEPLLRENPDDHLTAVKREFTIVRQAGAPQATAPPGAAAAVAPAPIRPHEWAGLRVGGTRTADIVERLGAPLQETADSLLFRGKTMPSALPTESVVINTSEDGLVASIFVFPAYGTLDRDARALLGHGRLMTYGEFLRATGRTAFGAGTRAEGKLHYLPPDLFTESFPELGILVVYDSADVAARDRMVKLLIVY
ncbi:MAG: HEAT repeat domain-containing protein [Candidatus Rokubacteria bacterium]|nr:HEAT repeat domain-containing protein [Candidatus Rokubacteria bacterium]